MVAIALAETTTAVRDTKPKYSGEPVDAELAGALATAAAEAVHGVQGRPREPAELAPSAVYFDTEGLRLLAQGSRSGAGAAENDHGWHLMLATAVARAVTRTQRAPRRGRPAVGTRTGRASARDAQVREAAAVRREAVRPVRAREAGRLIKQVKAVQELLGEHQDSVVARGLLPELGAAAPAEGGNGFTFGWLTRDEQARSERVGAQLDSAWATLRRRARALTR